MSMTDPTPRLRDVYRWNDSFNAMEVATADRRFEQLIERRERLIERSRFGILALNGATTIGILSNYQELHSQLHDDLNCALMFFSLGMISALVSILFETTFVGHRAAQMFGHLSALRRIRATLDSELSEVHQKQLDQELKHLSERSKRGSTTKIRLDDSKDGLPNDFAFSPVALVTLNLGGGAWIGGVLLMLSALLK